MKEAETALSGALGEPLERGEALAAWLAGLGFAPREIEPLPADVSARRYARLISANGTTAILATYPVALAGVCARFGSSTEILAAAGVRVPEVLATACDLGWMLLEDLGRSTLADLRGRPWEDLAAYFRDAAAVAGRVARLPVAAVAALNPPLDRELLERELTQTRDLFLEPQGLLRDAPLAAALAAALARLCAEVAAAPAIPCHRDFMARNLMPLLDGRVAVLDHQDLRMGPPAYDLASLLNDTLFPPADVERELLDSYLPAPEDRIRFDRAAAQRTLKAVGSYAAFARRGADRHLPLIGPTLRRFVDHFARTPEGADLAPLLGRAWRTVLGG